MSDALRVDAEGLQSHAEVCDTAAASLSGITAPAAEGDHTQASTSAVTTGHSLIDNVTATLAGRATSTGETLRAAAASYTRSDGDSGQAISTVQV
ncbi:type VII secretion target [Mycolicibacterium sp. CBMA 226]|uniref:type VII secretion target n=1 Tax=Mycolicibacterium sp. CBMA 226 TaxID=2606611 RepID=UPI0014133201|nr:type VII secretion target [Mycolicibacterium sp. CBMA 226]